MACRGAVAKKHLIVAQALLDGASGYRALRAGGYSHYSARQFRAVLKKSWPLREAIRLLRERCITSFIARPRRTKYARRSVSFAVNTFCQSDIQLLPTNQSIRQLTEIDRKARAIAGGTTMHPIRCSGCYGPLEGKDFWCPTCRKPN